MGFNTTNSNIVQYANGAWTSFRHPELRRSGVLSFWAHLEEVSSPHRWIDIVVFALILGFGALQFFFAARASDFLHDDVFFADSAPSLIEHGFYGITVYAETTIPPP